MHVSFLSSLALAALLSLGLPPAAAAARPQALLATFGVVALPSITSFSPAYGVPGTTITLTGTDFADATEVQVNGVAAAFTVVSPTSITATVPVGATTGLLSVTTPEGTSSHSTPFTVVTNSPANCWLNIPLPDVKTTDVPIYVSGESGTLGGGAALTSVDLSLFHTWDSDLEISLISPAGQTVMLSNHNGYRGHNFGNPFNCPVEVTHFTDGAAVAIGAAPLPYIGSYRPDAPLTGFSAGSPNGVWTLRIIDGSGGDVGVLEYVKLNFVAPAPDLVVSTAATVPAGAYRNLTITGAGVAQLGGPVTVEGELRVQNGGALHPNCQPITGPGTFTLEAGATLSICDAAGITDAGSSGAVQLTGVRTYSADAIYLYTGTVAQVTGNGLPATVRSLRLANAAGLTLSYSVTATQTLGLSQGVLNTNGWTATLGPEATLTESVSSYVTGLVAATRNLSSAAANDFGGLGLKLTPQATSTTLPGLTTVRRTTGAAVANLSPNHGILRYYDVQPANNGNLNVTLTFGYAEAELAGLARNELTLYRSITGVGGPWQPAGYTSREPAANTVTLAGVNHFSTWTLGNTTAPLPVELAAFTAQQQGEAAALRWTTAQEKNNDYFEVEASPDGRAFRSLGRVAGQGSTSARHYYRFDDGQLLRYGAATVYYRLRQVDRDGITSYSPVRAVAVGPVQAAPRSLAVYPTVLASGEALRFALSGPAVAANAELTVYSAAGLQVSTHRLGPDETPAVPLPALPAGWYLVKLVLADGQVLTSRFGVN